jgi:Type I phosphodiesterase / nucleotide pyrophosphatase
MVSALAVAGGGVPVPPASGPTHGKTLPAGPEEKPAAQWVSGGAGGESFLLTKRPKLVVVIAIDQFRADYLTKFDPYFGATGFRRLLSRAATWTGHYGHYATYTGPGHALLLSGSYATRKASAKCFRTS